MTNSIVKRAAFAAAASISLVAVSTPANAADMTTSAQVAAPIAGAHSAPGASVLGVMTFDHHKKHKKYKHRKRAKHYHHYANGHDQRVYRSTRIWRGRDGRAYCRRDDGTTGLLIGAGVGALIGNELAGSGDRTLGAILGAAGGALLGREFDRSNMRCR